MRSPTKLFAAPNRKSRFHTEHGRLMPLSAWLHLPIDLIIRISGRTDTGPWIVPFAVAHLERIMRPDHKVFEFGCGYSTAWLAARSAHVISLEHDPRWLAEVNQQLSHAGLTNCELRLVEPVSFPSEIQQLPDETFDLVIVDGQDTPTIDRVDCVASAAPKVRRGGHLLLDDSDIRRYARVNSVLEGWSVRRFTGMKPYPLVATETSIYRRPPSGR